MDNELEELSCMVITFITPLANIAALSCRLRCSYVLSCEYLYILRMLYPGYLVSKDGKELVYIFGRLIS